jgi:excisionase family DNA binding protein
MSREVDRLLVSVGEAAERLSVGRSFMYTLLMRGEVASVKLGRSRRVPMSALEAYVQRLQEAQVEEEVSK